MGYEWDIFISYKKDYKSDIDKYSMALRKRWLEETFLPVFSLALSGELGRNPQIYWDRRLEIGDLYEQELLTALSRSRCLIAILSNPYLYDSEWCLREFCFMKKRYELSRENHPNTYIYPILYQTTNIGHPLIQGLQYSDFTKYNKVGKAFWDSVEFLHFQDDMQEAVKKISRVINDPPEWSEEWTSRIWVDSVNDMVNKNKSANIPRVSSADVQL